MNDLSTQVIRERVQEHYGRLAEASLELETAGCCGTNSDAEDACCGSSTGDVSCGSSSLYEVDTSWLPGEMTEFSMGCGDPIALAELQQGQTVLDLGSGGGLDCFLAAERVGEEGHVIGVDMTTAMLAKANRNKEKLGLNNVEFREGHIEALPIDSETIDVIISNCVINLSPDKQAALNEAFRVLKPGGRLALSDMVTLGEFSAAERADMSGWTGCVTGAPEVRAYVQSLRTAGFENISLRDKANPTAELAGFVQGAAPAKAFSARITAEKPH